MKADPRTAPGQGSFLGLLEWPVKTSSVSIVPPNNAANDRSNHWHYVHVETNLWRWKVSTSTNVHMSQGFQKRPRDRRRRTARRVPIDIRNGRQRWTSEKSSKVGVKRWSECDERPSESGSSTISTQSLTSLFWYGRISAKRNVAVLLKLPYIPNLALLISDFFFFPKVKNELKGHQFGRCSKHSTGHDQTSVQHSGRSVRAMF